MLDSRLDLFHAPSHTNGVLWDRRLLWKATTLNLPVGDVEDAVKAIERRKDIVHEGHNPLCKIGRETYDVFGAQCSFIEVIHCID